MLAVRVRHAAREAHGAAERTAEFLTDGIGVAVRDVGRARLALHDGRMQLRDAPLKLAHGESAHELSGSRVEHGHAGLGELARLHHVPVARMEPLQHLRVAHGDRALADKPLDLFGQVEQAHRVRDRRTPLLAHALGHLLVREVEVFLERAVADGLVDRVQVVALQVLGDRHHGGRRVVHVPHHHGHELQAGLGGRALAALAADELQLAVLPPTARQRLDDAVLANGLDKVLQRLAAELRARLPRRSFDLPRRNLQHALADRRGSGGWYERHDGRRRGHRRRRARTNQRIEAAADAAEAAVLLLRLDRGARGRLGTGRLLEKGIGRLLVFHGFAYCITFPPPAEATYVIRTF